MKKPEGVSRMALVEVTIDPTTISDEPMIEGEMQEEAEKALKAIFSRGMQRHGGSDRILPVVDLDFVEFEEFCPACEDWNITKKYIGISGGYECRCHACEHEWQEPDSWEKRRKELTSRLVTYAVRT